MEELQLEILRFMSTSMAEVQQALAVSHLQPRGNSWSRGHPKMQVQGQRAPQVELPSRDRKPSHKQMLQPKGNLLLAAHLGENTHEESHGECLASASLAPKGKMGRVVALQNRSKMPAQLGHLFAADVCIEDFLQYLELL